MTGVRATSADYIFPLDADDLLAPGGLRRLATVLDRHPEAAAAWGSVQCFGALEYVHRSRPSLDPWQVSYQNHLPIGCLYRRSALLEAGGWQLPGGLFAQRRQHRRRSAAPLLLKLALPAIYALPIDPTRKRLLGGVMTHLAYRNGWETLRARYRAHRVLRAG
jgi:hypothetical protein